MNLPYSCALVTGATGFVGRHIIDNLKAKGVSTHELSLPEGDITDKVALHKFLQKIRPEAVFHLAAYGTFGNEKDVEKMIQVNIQGTQNLLEASVASGVKSFVMAGSAKEYATGRTLISEDAPLQPWDAYAATKAAAEFFCSLTAQKHNIPVIVLRLSPVYGPGDSLSRFVSVAIKAALSHTPFTLATGDVVRNFTYIDDVVDAFMKASCRTSGGYEAFNVAHEAQHSFQDVLHAIELSTQQKILLEVVPPASSNDDSWVLDTTKAKQMLKFEPSISLEEGITRTVEWYTKNHV